MTGEQIDSMALSHALRLMMIAIISTHPNPKKLRTAYNAVVASAERMQDENIMMIDEVNPQTLRYMNHLRFSLNHFSGLIQDK